MERMLACLRELAVFMLAAQMIVHFLPGKQYEKYGKLIAGAAVLAKLSAFLLNTPELPGAAGDVGTELLRPWTEDSGGHAAGGEAAFFSERLEQMEEEREKAAEGGLLLSVEERLARPAARAGVTVRDVRLLDGVLVIEVAGEEKDAEDAADGGIGPVRVESVTVGRDSAAGAGSSGGAWTPDSSGGARGAGTSGGGVTAEAAGRRGTLRQDLAAGFSAALGMDEEDLEVIELEQAAGLVQKADDER